MKKLSRVAFALVLSLSLGACASFEKNAYRTIGTTVTAVDLAMSVYGELHRSGQTTPAQDAKVKAAYETYQMAVAAARGGIDAYKATGDQTVAVQALAVLAAAAAALHNEIGR